MPKLKIIDRKDKLLIEVDNVGIPYATAYEITRTASRSVILNLSIAMSDPEIEIESDNPVVIG